MTPAHNKAALDALGDTGSVPYVHARRTLAINPTAAMAAQFDGQAHRGLIRKYNTKANKRLLVADHSTADRRDFEDCIAAAGYGNWTLEYTS